MNFAKFLRTIFRRTSAVTASDYALCDPKLPGLSEFVLETLKCKKVKKETLRYTHAN